MSVRARAAPGALRSLAMDFDARAAELERLLATDRARAVSGLRALEEARARALLGLCAGDTHALPRLARGHVERGVDAALAQQVAAHLAAAERWQWEMGSWATGAGEGLASMADVRALQLARAWLLASPDRAAARRLLDEVERDPNRLGARHADDIAALRALLAS